MLSRHAAKLPEGVLNSLAECFKGFGETQRDGFDVAVRQHAVEERMVKSRSGDLDSERVTDREVACGEASWVVILWEENGLVRSVDGSPARDAALESSAC